MRGNAIFAGDLHLAEAAGGRLNLKSLLDIGSGFSPNIGVTAGFVMAAVINGGGWAAFDAGTAGPFGKPQAVVVVRLIRARCCRKGNFCYDRADAHRLTQGGDQTVRQAEGAESGDKSGVAFRPVGGNSNLVRLAVVEQRRAFRSDGRKAGVSQLSNKMLPQLTVEYFTVMTRERPSWSRVVRFLTLVCAGCRSLRQNIGDDG